MSAGEPGREAARRIVLDRGRTQEALGAFSEAVRLDPALSAAHEGLGLCYTRWGQRGDAVASWREAARLDPSSAVLQYDIGAAFWARGDMADAVAHLEAALRLDPGYRQARGWLGLAYWRQGRRGRAVREWAMALIPVGGGGRGNLRGRRRAREKRPGKGLGWRNGR